MRLQSFKCAPPRYLLHGPALMDNDIDSNTYQWIYDAALNTADTLTTITLRVDQQ